MSQISFAGLADFNSIVPWGLWVAIYIWLVGISAGSFLLVSLGNLMNNAPLKKLSRLGISFSLAALLAGLLSILVDLGHIERFYKLFISPSPTSVMAWMVWLYNVYAVILVAALFSLKKGIPKLFWQCGFLFALAVIVIESLLFSLPPGRPWHSVLFSLHFLSSSLASGIAALIFIPGIFWAKSEKPELLKGLSKIAIPILVINLIVEIIDLASHGNIGNIGNWLLPLASVIIIVFLLRNNLRSSVIAGGIGLLAALLSKYQTLIAGQLSEPFKGFAGAYIEPRLQVKYGPTAFEYLVAIFLIILAMGLFYFVYKIFPLTREE